MHRQSRQPESPRILSVVQMDASELPPGMNLRFTEEDFLNACSSQDGSIGHHSWEMDSGDGGYDIITYSVSSLRRSYSLIVKFSWFIFPSLLNRFAAEWNAGTARNLIHSPQATFQLMISHRNNSGTFWIFQNSFCTSFYFSVFIGSNVYAYRKVPFKFNSYVTSYAIYFVHNLVIV